MLVDARTVERNAIVRADVCIVGAGAAGITLASALERSGASIALLESGGWEADPYVQSLYDGVAEGDLIGVQPTYLSSSRLRFFGGSTNHWTGWCAPLDPIDFEERAWVPHSGWPISHEQLEPYYCRAAEIVEIPPFDHPVAERLSPSKQLLLEKSRRVVTKFLHFSPPTRFGEVYRPSLTASKKISVLLHANVTEIQVVDNSSAVERVVVGCVGGNRFTVEARWFVLATGGIENARLLLLSNRVQRSGLGNGNNLVGRFFGDHPHLDAAYLLVTDTRLPMELYGFHEHEKYGDRSLGVLSIAADVQREKQLLNLRAHLWPSTAEEAGQFARAVGGVAADVDGARPSRPEERDARYYRVRVSCECPPNRASRVALADEVDALGQRRVKLDLRIDPQAHASLRGSLAIIGRELGQGSQGRAQIFLDEEDPWSEAWGGSHHLGTTRMSADAKHGVVDADCRVHGIANLFVAGSSVFPTFGFANPTLTIVALTLRLADHLQRSLRG